MSKPVLAIDVDITTLSSDFLWWEWLENMCGMNTAPLREGTPVLCLEDLYDDWERNQHKDYEVEYDLSKYFGSPINKRVDKHSFWRSENIYDFVHPVNGAIDGVTKLSEHFDIVFVTHVKGLHSRSKYNCLERCFGHIPFDYVVTKEKHRVAADLLIDDRNEFINQFLTSNRCAVKLLTPYTQSESLIDTDNLPMRSVYKEAKDWDEIVEHVYEIFPF